MFHQACSIINSSAMNSRSRRALVSRYAVMATPDSAATIPAIVGTVALDTPEAMDRGITGAGYCHDLEHFDHSRHRAEQTKQGAQGDAGLDQGQVALRIGGNLRDDAGPGSGGLARMNNPCAGVPDSMGLSDQLLVAGAHVHEALDDEHPHEKRHQADDPLSTGPPSSNEVPDGLEERQVV